LLEGATIARRVGKVRRPRLAELQVEKTPPLGRLAGDQHQVVREEGDHLQLSQPLHDRRLRHPAGAHLTRQARTSDAPGILQ
jgi:hypothetical protein